MRALT